MRVGQRDVDGVGPYGIGQLPLVMLHGGGPGASSWSNFGSALERFAASFRTILVDQPGFGGSDKPPVVGNYYRFAADHVLQLLDERELAEIRAHPVEGTWLIAGVPSLSPALPYVLFHHERWDGDGYPTRRAGSAIPLEGRVLAVADAFDAMTSLRPYRRPLSAPEAADEIHRCAGTQFDPEVADAFLGALEAGELLPGEAARAA